MNKPKPRENPGRRSTRLDVDELKAIIKEGQLEGTENKAA